MTRDWQWHGDGLTGLPITVTTATIAGASGAADDAWLDVVGSGVSVVSGGARPPRMQFARAASTACAIRRPTHAARTVGQETFYLEPPTSPVLSGAGAGVAWTVLTVRNGTALCFRLQFITITHGTDPADASVRLLDATSTQIGAVSASAIPYSSSSRVRVEVDWECKTSTTGEITVKVFDGDTTTQLGNTISSTTANLTSTAGNGYTQEIFGTDNTTATEAYTYWLDDVMRGTARTDGGPYTPASTPPEVTTSISDTTPSREGGDTVQLVGAATTAAGSISSTSWKATPGHAVTEAAFGTAAVSGSTRNVVLPYTKAATTYSFTFTATNSAGQSTTAVQTVTALGWLGWYHDAGPGGTVGTARPIIEDVAPEPTKPVLTLGTTGVGDTQVSIPWSIVLNGYNAVGRVTGVEWFKRRKSDGAEAFTGTVAGTVSGTGPTATRSGTITAGRLTNDVVYTVTVTPIIDGAPDTTLAKSVDVTPRAGVVVSEKRRMGVYWSRSAHTYAEVVNNMTGGDPEMLSNYIQPGLAKVDPASKNVDGTAKPFTRGVGPAANDPGNPYTTAGAHPVAAMGITSANGARRIGTWYRDMQPVPAQHFQGWEQPLIDGAIAKDQGFIMTYAIWETSSIKWVGLATDASGNFVAGVADPTISGNPVVTKAQWDWAVAWQDMWIEHFATNFTDKAPVGHDAWAVITHELEVGANSGTAPNWGSATAANPINHPDAPKWHARWQSRFFLKARARGVRSALWIGSMRADGFMDAVLSNLVAAPDLIAGDPYVNQDAFESAEANFAGFTKQFTDAPGAGTIGRHNADYVRLSRLARLGVPAAPSGTYTPIPLGIPEHAQETSNHTDAEMANYIEGTSPATNLSIREAMRKLGLKFANWFTSGGPAGPHDLLQKTGGTYDFPLALAAYRREHSRTDVTG